MTTRTRIKLNKISILLARIASMLFGLFVFFCGILNPLPHKTPFKTFANKADPDQAALVRAA